MAGGVDVFLLKIEAARMGTPEAAAKEGAIFSFCDSSAGATMALGSVLASV